MTIGWIGRINMTRMMNMKDKYDCRMDRKDKYVGWMYMTVGWIGRINM